MTPELKQHLYNIVDTFTGADGAIRFTKFKFGIEALESQAAAGDTDAEQIVEVVVRFSRLIDAIAGPNT